MKTILKGLLIFLTILLFSCGDDNIVNNNNNNNNNIIFSRFGLVDSIYNTTGTQQFHFTTLDTIDYSNINHINIKLKLNGFGVGSRMKLQTVNQDSSFYVTFFEVNQVTNPINIDTNIVVPQHNITTLFISTSLLNDWITMKDLVITKVD